MINGVNSNPYSSQLGYTNDKKNNGRNITQSSTEDTGVILDIGSDDSKSAVYHKPSGKLNAEEINRLWAETNRAAESLRTLVEELIHTQGKKTEDLISGKDVLIVNADTKAKAEKMISEDGDWGVKAVSARIVDFAKALSGGDKSKLDELRSAIEKGFGQAKEILGGTLPDISRKTYDEVMKQLDAWEK